MKEIYLKYSSLILDTEVFSNPPAIERDTFKLLEIIAVAHYKNKSITVSEAMKLTIIASPASIHRKLNYLREFEYIDSFFKDKNRRTQYLKPLSKSEIIFNQKGDLLLKVLAENKETNNKPTIKSNTKDFYC